MITPPKFNIQQIAIYPPNPTKARKLLEDLGMTDWFHDNVHASGVVRGVTGENQAHLQFNYQAGSGVDAEAAKPLEFEVLHYTDGHNWMVKNGPSVSHLGMHVTAEELEQFRAYFFENSIGVAQEVNTLAHTNPVIKDERRYTYAIFDTREVLGVDLKFIVRRYINGASLTGIDTVKSSQTKVSAAAADIERVLVANWPVQGARRVNPKATQAKSKPTKTKR